VAAIYTIHVTYVLVILGDSFIIWIVSMKYELPE